MRNWLSILLILILVALDWATLHDILKGDETSYSSEYVALGASLLAFAAFAWGWKRSAEFNRLAK